MLYENKVELENSDFIEERIKLKEEYPYIGIDYWAEKFMEELGSKETLDKIKEVTNDTTVFGSYYFVMGVIEKMKRMAEIDCALTT